MDDKSVEVQILIRTIQIPSISKASLQSICSVNGISRSGNKSDLQRRIIQRELNRSTILDSCFLWQMSTRDFDRNIFPSPLPDPFFMQQFPLPFSFPKAASNFRQPFPAASPIR